MAINSRQKGKKGELEACAKLREHGWEARRSQQYAGINHDADILGLPGHHIEVKRVERLNIEDAMTQAKTDCKNGEIPIVMHRKNHCEWLITIKADDYLTKILQGEWEEKEV